ncbi:hydrophobic surface binding protein A-domain-containing protein [Hysterangium stoloniferum]|nr:hydrophobic surface binding protein A-domain-containing protein [Hysterangium stoloniferum]
MVRLFGSLVIVFTLTLAALSTPSGKADSATAFQHIDAISSSLHKLNASITSFPDSGGSFSQAVSIFMESARFSKTMKQGITYTKAITINDADGTAIFQRFYALQPVIHSTLDGFINKKSALQSLPVPGISAIVKSRLKAVQQDSNAFDLAAIAAGPAALKANCTAVKAAIDSAFSKAIAAYAG